MPHRLGKVLVRIWLTGDLRGYHEPAFCGFLRGSALSYIAARDNIEGRHGGYSWWGWGTQGSDAVFPRRRAWCQGCSVRAPQLPATHTSHRIRRMSAQRRNSSAMRCKVNVLWEPGLLQKVTQRRHFINDNDDPSEPHEAKTNLTRSNIMPHCVRILFTRSEKGRPHVCTPN